jgi:hypothetical protein
VIKNFQALINCVDENINIHWIIDLNTWTSFGIWICWATYLGHICRLDEGNWFCHKTYICRGGGYICEKTMRRSCWLVYYRITRLVPNPKLNGCIWYCVPLFTTKAWSKVC